MKWQLTISTILAKVAGVHPLDPELPRALFLAANVHSTAMTKPAESFHPDPIPITYSLSRLIPSYIISIQISSFFISLMFSCGYNNSFSGENYMVTIITFSLFIKTYNRDKSFCQWRIVNTLINISFHTKYICIYIYWHTLSIKKDAQHVYCQKLLKYIKITLIIYFIIYNDNLFYLIAMA